MQPPPQRVMPGHLQVAVRLMYVGAVLSAVGLVLAFSSHTARAIPIGNPHTAAYQEGVVFGRLSFGAVAAGLWLWMSWAVRRAKRWARVVSVVFFLLGAEPTVASLLERRWVGAVILSLATLVGMAVVILLYQRESSPLLGDRLMSAGNESPPGYEPSAGLGTQASHQAPAPDGIGQTLETVPFHGQPTSPAARPRVSSLAVIAVGVVAAAMVAAVIVDVVGGSPKAPTSRAGSTASIRVIVPAPAEAGGLQRDYAAENTPTFRSGIATVRQHYGQVMHATSANIAVAVYAGIPSGTAGAGPSVTLVYIGVNSPPDLPNKGTAVDLVGGAVARMSNVSATALRGGPGDTSNECATGVDQGQHVVVCGWSTDRSFGLLIQNSPGGTISELASAMMHMRPDLVRG